MEEQTQQQPEATEAPPEQQQEVLQEAKIAPEVQAAYYLHGAIPSVRRLIENLTGVQAKRVLTALLEFPFENTVNRFTTKEAEMVFNMGTLIQNSKFILFLKASGSQELIEKSVDEVNSQLAETNNEGETSNG